MWRGLRALWRVLRLLVHALLGLLVVLLRFPRLSPEQQQARVQAYIVPVAAEVAGRVVEVQVSNNQRVVAGQALFAVDPEQYQIALERAQADLESMRRQIGAGTLYYWRASDSTWQAAEVKNTETARAKKQVASR